MKTKIFIAILLSVICTTACNRFLDEKSDLRLSIPETIGDNQALLDDSNSFSNTAFSGEFSADDFYLSDSDYDGLAYEETKGLYTWQPDHVSLNSDYGNDWYYAYKTIFIANTVLYNIEKYHIANADNIKGQALATRASRYLDIVQIFCPVYNAATAASDLGLPLRLDPDMNPPSKRASVQDTYNQILSDLHAAVALLPDKQIAPTRISKVAALGLLARTYLYMGDYRDALQYAQQALSIYDVLIDYNTLNAQDAYPIKDQNPEVISQTTMAIAQLPYQPKLSESIYQTFSENDLRKSIYFKMNNIGEILFRGNYTGDIVKLSGITTDELYLIVAECLARENNVSAAMDTLNQLLITRWKTGTYINKTAGTKQEALNIILTERRKELLFRAIRWADLKRYNRDGANITLTRSINGKTYILPPNDPRYAISIPEEIIISTGMPQNKR